MNMGAMEIERKMESSRKGGREDTNEEEESLLDMHTFVRDDILETVDECLRVWKDGHGSLPPVPLNPFHRCVVCTLPHGTCRHTKEWLDSRAEDPILEPLPRDNIEISMDDVSDVLNQTPVAVGSLGEVNPTPPLQALRWETLVPEKADEISLKKLDLSSPSSRSGHSMVLLEGPGSWREDTRMLIVFGGVTMKGQGTFEPYLTVLDSMHVETTPPETSDSSNRGRQNMVYCDEVFVFRGGHSTWHRPKMAGKLPAGRYGHVALPLEGEVMWMFGGRVRKGGQVGDTFLLHTRSMRWEQTNYKGDGWPGPEPRFWSSAIKVRERILLFGGADIRSGRNLNDLWAWDISTRRWTEQIVVGTPPLARHGHKLINCPDGRALVLGGCCVRYSEEEGLAQEREDTQMQIRIAADRVTRAYDLEEAEVSIGGLASYMEISKSVPKDPSTPYGNTPFSSRVACQAWKRLLRQQAQLATNVASREIGTALLEADLKRLLHSNAVSAHWAHLQASHPLEHLDLTWLDTENMIWEVPTFPPVTGRFPCARMHFSANLIGQKVIVWGGCRPTIKKLIQTDENVYVLDLFSLRWSSPLGEGTSNAVQPRVTAAEGQLRRVQRTLQDAKQRAMTLGVPGGRTMQVVEAESLVSANQWRVEQLRRERDRAVPMPTSRTAHAGCTLGHRVMYFGGLGVGGEHGEMLVLDIESPDEKERRLGDEFHLRLERERQERDMAESAKLRLLSIQERMRKGKELELEGKERCAMSYEDERSAIPELTVAPTPQLRCANSTTLWLEWDQPLVDSIGGKPGQVEYTLYMRGGFHQWEEGDTVSVEYLTKAQRRAAAAAEAAASTSYLSSNDDVLSLKSAWCGGASSFPGGVSHNTNCVDIQGPDHGGDARDGNISVLQAPGSEACPEVPKPQPTDSGQNRKKRSMQLVGSCPTATGGVSPSGNPILPATVVGVHSNGLFDIRWGDGEDEKALPRHRLNWAIPPPWTVVYQGFSQCYAVEGMVPLSVLERERAHPYQVQADFSLQISGTEWPRDKHSQHSSVVTFQTDYNGQGPLLQENNRSCPSGGGAPAIPKAKLDSARALDCAISLGGSVAASRGPPASRALHGVYSAAGKGKDYI